MSEPSTREILDKLLERRSFLIKELSTLDSLIGVYKGLWGDKDTESLPEEQLNLYQWPSSRAAQAAEIARAIDAARKIIIQNQRPMKRNELVEELERQGYSFPGKDKNKVFGTNIWRSGKFRTVEDKGYWPKDVPFPKL